MDMDNGEGTDYGSGGRLGGEGQRGKKWDNCNRTTIIKKTGSLFPNLWLWPK